MMKTQVKLFIGQERKDAPDVATLVSKRKSRKSVVKPMLQKMNSTAINWNNGAEKQINKQRRKDEKSLGTLSSTTVS
jgi:hypothetical protein